MNAGTPLTLPPELRARLRTLRVRPRLASGASGIGQHASRSRGAGLEFAQYRAYEPGDELRQIDWKLYARSDRFFVRESERESPITVWLLLDATASAGQADRAAPQRTRLDHMRGVAACVVELALQQGDRFGLLAINGDGLQLVPAANGARQRDRVHLQLHALQARGGWPVADRLRPLWERVRPGDLLLAIGSNPALSIVAMIALAMVVSICSNVDSFFALSFASTFTPGSIVAFLLVGPLVDVKMLALLRTTFTTRTLVGIVVVVVLSAFAMGTVVNLLA